jgi:hypothetical protein
VVLEQQCGFLLQPPHQFDIGQVIKLRSVRDLGLVPKQTNLLAGHLQRVVRYIAAVGVHACRRKWWGNA